MADKQLHHYVPYVPKFVPKRSICTHKTMTNLFRAICVLCYFMLGRRFSIFKILNLRMDLQTKMRMKKNKLA